MRFNPVKVKTETERDHSLGISRFFVFGTLKPFNSFFELLCLFFIIFSSACKIDMDTDIYLRDIRDVAIKNTEGLHTPGLLKVGIPNCKNKEELSEVTDLLKDYFINVSEKACEAGMESLLSIGIDIPIINSPQDWASKTSSTTALVRNKSRDESYILVDFVLNKTKFENLNSAVKSKFFDKLSFDESTVSFSVNNDGRQKEEAVISDSFVDGKPIIYSKRFTLARRSKINVEVVFKEAILKAVKGQKGFKKNILNFLSSNLVNIQTFRENKS